MRVIQSDYVVWKPSTLPFRASKESCSLQHGRTALRDQEMKAAETEEEGGLAGEDAAEAEDVVVVVVEAVATSQGLLMTRAHKSRDNEKKPTRARVQTIIARLSEIRRWREVDSPGEGQAIEEVRVTRRRAG